MSTMTASFMPLVCRVGLAFAIAATLSACRSDSGRLPPVFGAVFGLDSAERIPFRTGKIPDPVVGPGDAVVGDAANNPGQCIYRSPENRRFRAPCPEGYAIGASG